MHIPPGGGPPPHRHDFEETFTILEGELSATFRGKTQVVRAGETIHVPSNAPHQFSNLSAEAVRLLCICSPAGLDEFFLEVGISVASRTTPPPSSTKQHKRNLKPNQKHSPPSIERSSFHRLEKSYFSLADDC
jgi:uncharacterized cupin superfamily protein